MLPDWLDLASCENTAVAKVRQLRGGGEETWGELIASAQATIGFYQDFPIENIRSLYEEANAIPLIAAARIFDAASQTPDVDEKERIDLAIAAAIAFAMYGNSVTASAICRRLLSKPNLATPALAVVFGTVAPQVLGKVQSWCQDGSLELFYLEKLNAYLRYGSTDLVEQLRSDLIKCMLQEEISSFDRSLILSCQLCLEHLFFLSIASALPAAWPACSPNYIGSLVDSGVYTLLPPQFRAVSEKRLLESSANTLIALPTSAGKTLLGELCLIASLGDDPGLVCFLAPYVALGRQVAESLRSHLPKGYLVRTLVGGHRDEADLDPNNNAEVIVATPERLDSILRAHPVFLAKLKCIVCDEVHLIQSGTRGVLLEGLLARLRLLQTKGAEFRIVLTSAVLPEYQKLVSWIDIPPEAVITDSWKPTARRLARWSQDGKLVWYVGADPVRRAGATNESVIGTTDIPWPKKSFYGSGKIGAIQKQEPDVFENIAYLVEVLHRRYGGGTIFCYCSSRHSTRSVAAAIGQRFPNIEPLPQKLATVVSLIESRHKVLKPLAELLRKGIAYHNASLPHEIRTHIEEAVKQREIIVITATTTLAEGVDLPFRFTILTDWLTWEGIHQRPMQSLLFRNIAGRCGRAGVMTEGDTIIFDNPLGEPKYTNPYQRGTIQTDTFIKPPSGGLKSMLALTNPSADEYEGYMGVLSSQFLAAIQENPDEGDLVTALGERLYSTQFPEVAPGIYRHLSTTRESLLDETLGALAVAASPLKLTEFGKAAMRTTFSPASCRTIVQKLKGDRPPDDTAGLANYLLVQFGALPEQAHEKLRKVLAGKKNNQFQVKQEDLTELLKLWVRGDAHEEMFLSLPVLKRSKKQPKVETWAAGLTTPSPWDDDFEKFCDVVRAVFREFLPWLMSTCQALSPTAGGWATRVDWDKHARFIENGVDSEWAVVALHSSIHAERRPAAALGRVFPPLWFSEADKLGLGGLRRMPDRKRQFDHLVHQLISGVGGINTIRGSEIRELVNQLCIFARIPSPVP